MGPESLAELTPNVPGELADYLLLTRVARGGMADVYLGEHLERGDSDDYVAVKVLLPRLAKRRKFVDMFMAEGRLGVMLDHPNIVHTYDVGSVGLIRYIAMEFIHGQDLGRMVRFFRNAGAPVPVDVALYVVHAVLSGLDHAHHLEDETGQPLQLVNRDVSPANIMLGFDGSVRLIDFGIAQALLDYRSQIGSIKGKVTYMSPEQVRGLALDARSDLFSLGTVLYQLLTMNEPFQGPSEFEQMERVREANPPPVGEANPRIDNDLSDLVGRAMARDPADRYQSAREMRDAIEAYCARHSVEFDREGLASLMANEFVKARRKLADDISDGRRQLAAQPNELEVLPDDDDFDPRPKPVVANTPQPAEPAPPRTPANPKWMLPAVIALILVAVGLVLLIILRN